VFALVGYAARTARALRDLVPARLLIINAIDSSSAYALLQQSSTPAPFGIIRTTALPLVPNKLDGLAIASNARFDLMEASGAVRVRGRLVAAASSVLPVGMRELVRDRSVWVAEREAIVSPPVELRRRH
jgi:hypothetical protein